MGKPLVTASACPRCGGFIPSNDNPGAYRGALSRADNTTEVCSDCGREEALLEHFAGDLIYPIATWPLWQYDVSNVQHCRTRYLAAQVMILRNIAVLAPPKNGATSPPAFLES